MTIANDDFRTCRGQDFQSGHRMHHIQARLASTDDRNWRRARITNVDGCRIDGEYCDGSGPVSVWHHVSLADVLRLGDSILINEVHDVLRIPKGTWCSIVVLNGDSPAKPPSRGALIPTR